MAKPFRFGEFEVTPDLNRIRHREYDAEPVQLTFKKRGYRPKQVSVDPRTQRSVQVELQARRAAKKQSPVKKTEPDDPPDTQKPPPKVDEEGRVPLF